MIVYYIAMLSTRFVRADDNGYALSHYKRPPSGINQRDKTQQVISEILETDLLLNDKYSFSVSRPDRVLVQCYPKIISFRNCLRIILHCSYHSESNSSVDNSLMI